MLETYSRILVLSVLETYSRILVLSVLETYSRISLRFVLWVRGALLMEVVPGVRFRQLTLYGRALENEYHFYYGSIFTRFECSFHPHSFRV